MSDTKRISKKAPSDAAALRKQAEQKARSQEPSILSAQSPEAIQQMFHELRVHQIELEMQNEEMHQAYIEIEEMRNRYFDLYDLAPVGYTVISEKGLILEANLTTSTLLGMNRSRLIKQSLARFILKEDTDLFYLHHKKLFKTGEPQSCELRLIKPDGSDFFWARLDATTMKDPSGTSVCHLVLSDITKRKRAEDALRDSLERFRIAQDFSPDGFTILRPIRDTYNRIVDFSWVYENTAIALLNGTDREEVVGKRLLELFPSHRDTSLLNTYIQVAQSGIFQAIEASYAGESMAKSTWFRIVVVPMVGDIAILAQDITERKQAEDRLEHQRNHDFLTGLYNRGYLENEFVRLEDAQYLPVSLIIADTNGLKLINDSFGHKMGDVVLQKAAELLKKNCRPQDIVARYGGDEFVMLLPNTTSAEAESRIKEIESTACKVEIESIQLTLSYGYQTRDTALDDFAFIFKKAEDMMYRNKLYESSSAKSKTIGLVINSLFAKSDRESQHSKRVSRLCEFIATKMNMSAREISRMRTAGLMHDIGKIGISEVVLNNPGKLTTEQWKEIKRHPETGYRILAASSDFIDIATAILEHHERWDGGGYPRSIAGESISLQARIITIADAYDAMTSERPYKHQMTIHDAIEEIRNCSGKHFDPQIASVFIDHYQEFTSHE